MSRVPYSSVMGSLMYTMVCSCPDLAYAVNVVNKYMAKPGKESSSMDHATLAWIQYCLFAVW